MNNELLSEHRVQVGGESLNYVLRRPESRHTHADRKCGYPESLVEFYCTDDPGHTMGYHWYDKGTKFLLNL
ncbi:hypothetical protein PV433_02250 [Paenibacillus sp. GYB004]|uniref:hypothetical protein n=1 Tax=Paenibacillus sp. GYB004 TaxID=2994393 RepID=UPI002F96D862